VRDKFSPQRFFSSVLLFKEKRKRQENKKAGERFSCFWVCGVLCCFLPALSVSEFVFVPHDAQYLLNVL